MTEEPRPAGAPEPSEPAAPSQPAAAAAEGAVPPPYDDEFVWTFRGYRLRAGEFTTAMVHFFRAEVQRANTWRQRLDTTTNWAVISTGAAISFAFGGKNSTDHGVIILNTLLITMFLYIEARRYRYYELWSARVRLMETDFFAAMLVPPFRPGVDWAESLAENLLNPRFNITALEAFGRRYRRNYVWMYLLLAVAWFTLLWLHPQPAESLRDIVDRAAIGDLPGGVVIAAGVAYNGLLFVIGVLTIGLRKATGEIHPRYGALDWFNWQATGAEKGARAWFRPSTRREQLLTLVITDQAEAVGQRILSELHRGVTELAGRGMYTGKPHSVLMCALTVTEVHRLESLVRDEDPHAFIIVSPVQEVRGSGFVPLREDEAGVKD
jgi:uncharacterized membrane protein